MQKPHVWDGPAKSVDRRDFVLLAGSLALSGLGAGNEGLRHISTKRPSHVAPDFELQELGVRDLQEGMAAGRWSSHRLVELYSGWIEQLDQRGPTLRHILEVNPDALSIADQLDAERRAGKLRGPLHGIPVLLKDNIDTADRMTTTAGSLALEGSRATADAFLVERLRAAGAIPLAKTSMSEWANFRSSRSSSGWCSRGGQGKNPYVLDRSPCGSSSGTGGGIAASYATVGIGTETDGSITCPSSISALVGIKPTVGLVSRSGIIPISATQDTAGPMCRTVTDAAILLASIVGVDPRDSATEPSRTHAESDYTRFLSLDALKGRRLGVTRKGFTGYHDGTDQLFEEAIAVLQGLGAVIVDPADLKTASGGDEELDVLLYEFKAGVNAYLGGLSPSAPARTLADLVAINERERGRVMPYFGQELFVDAESKGPLTEKGYRKALATCRRRWRTEGIDATMDRFQLDALIAPTGNPAWPIDLVNGDHFTGGATTPAAVAGYPHITVPAGSVHGLPVGLSIYGRAWTEPMLIGMAYAYEQATKHRRAPEFLATLDIGAPV